MHPTVSPLDRAREFNSALENYYLQLALELVDIRDNESWKGEFDSFEDFYVKDLGREKSTVSRLLKAGAWLKESNAPLPAGNVSYKKLCAAIAYFPDKDPSYVISAAKTLSYSQMMDEKAEGAYGEEHEHKPKDAQRWGKCECGKYVRA